MKEMKSKTNTTFLKTTRYKIVDESEWDMDRYKEEIIKIKSAYNKVSQEYQDLKIDYNKLLSDHKTNMKMIDEIVGEINIGKINETLNKNEEEIIKENAYDETDYTKEMPNNMNKNVNENIDKNIDENEELNLEENTKKNIENLPQNNNENKPKKTSKTNTQNQTKRTKYFSDKAIEKMNKIYLIQRLKEEITELQNQLSEKDSIINDLKVDSKVLKYKQLDNKYAETFHQLNEYKMKYKRLQNLEVDFGILRENASQLFQQIDIYKKENKAQKQQLEKASLQIKSDNDYFEKFENLKKESKQKEQKIKEENDKIKSENINLKAKYNEQHEQIRFLRDKTGYGLNVNKIKNENKYAKERNKELENKVNELQKKLMDLQAQIDDLNKKKNDTKKDDNLFLTNPGIVKENDIKDDKKVDVSCNDNKSNNNETKKDNVQNTESEYNKEFGESKKSDMKSESYNKFE